MFDLTAIASKRIEEIERAKEQYIKAFLDETGWKASECVLVIRNTFDGYEIAIRKRKEGEQF